MGRGQSRPRSGWWRSNWKSVVKLASAFIVGGGLVAYLNLGLSLRRLHTEEAEKGLHLYPRPRFLLERTSREYPPAMQVHTWFLDDAYLPREGKPAEASIAVQLGIGNPFSMRAVLVNDGDTDAVSLAVKHFYLLFDRRRMQGAFLAMQLEEGDKARETDHRREGDWIYTRAFGPRESIIKGSVFPQSEFNPKGAFLDVYWFKARYYRPNDVSAFSVEEVFVYDGGRILRRTDAEQLDEFGAIDASIQKIVRKYDL